MSDDNQEIDIGSNTISIGMGANISITMQSNEESLPSLVQNALKIIHDKEFKALVTNVAKMHIPKTWGDGDCDAGYE